MLLVASRKRRRNCIDDDSLVFDETFHVFAESAALVLHNKVSVSHPISGNTNVLISLTAATSPISDVRLFVLNQIQDGVIVAIISVSVNSGTCLLTVEHDHFVAVIKSVRLVAMTAICDGFSLVAWMSTANNPRINRIVEAARRQQFQVLSFAKQSLVLSQWNCYRLIIQR